MVTIPWCSENDEKHRRPCGTATLYDSTERLKLDLDTKENKKKETNVFT